MNAGTEDDASTEGELVVACFRMRGRRKSGFFSEGIACCCTTGAASLVITGADATTGVTLLRVARNVTVAKPILRLFRRKKLSLFPDRRRVGGRGEMM